MEQLCLTRPAPEHRAQYEEMMDEWEHFGGRLNPGALRRYSRARGRTVSYEEWLSWIAEDRASSQDLFFLLSGDALLGAVSIRYRCDPVDGHAGFGIRPSRRRQGYGSKLLRLALPVLRDYGIDPAVVSCDRENIASARVIQSAGGVFVQEVPDGDKIVQIYHIDTGRP